jgi:general secretion pathway protein I
VSRTRAQNRMRGFTLLEVVVAFAILTLALSALYEVFRLGLRGQQTASHEQAALEMAQKHLAELGSLRPLAEGKQSGKEDIYTWSEASALVTPKTGEAPYTIPAYQLSVQVDWQEAGASRDVTLETVRLEPTRNAGS